MKTVIDAVNELKGVFPYHSSFARLIHHAFDLKIGFSDYYGTGVNSAPNSNWYLVCDQDEFNQCVAEMSEGSFVPKASKNMIEAVYTQAMADNDELPEVGMICNHQSVKKRVIAPIDYNNKIVLISVDNGIYSLAHCNDIEPIKAPVKLVEGHAYQFEYRKLALMAGIYRAMTDSFYTVGGDWATEHCTNITPLVPAT